MSAHVRRRRKAADQVAEWNTLHVVGDRVIVRRDNGKPFHTTTRSEAQLSRANGVAVIFVEGIAGYYLLERVQGEEA